jgi:hypothetical protein
MRTPISPKDQDTAGVKTDPRVRACRHGADLTFRRTFNVALSPHEVKPWSPRTQARCPESQAE